MDAKIGTCVTNVEPLVSSKTDVGTMTYEGLSFVGFTFVVETSGRRLGLC